ncbi:MAG: hypothetical protein KDA86_22000 [Planctomycetaceae bacterium]|nr:hypothetical protein [Planctomycetaceae bacterium]
MQNDRQRKAAYLGAVLATVTCLLLMSVALRGSNLISPIRHDPLPAEFRIVSSGITCGAVPESSDEFFALSEWGIHTIVSVDGMQPDLRAATHAGLKYVHIPIGYDGVSQDAIGRMTRVLRDCESPIYVHCHHGKHRGPAAAAVCAMIAKEIDRQQAVQLLTDAGTSHDYPGLWRDVSHFEPLPQDAVLPEISSSVELEPLAAAMVEIDECWEKLQHALESSAQEQALEQANLLEQLFRESSRLNGVNENCPWLPDMLTAESAGNELCENLRHHPDAVAKSVESVSACCRRCHQLHRN